MTQPATTPYTIDNDKTPVMPLTTVPLESMAPPRNAENDTNPAKLPPLWPRILLGAVAVVALPFALVYSVGFVVSAGEIDAALNALGIVAGAAYVGALVGALVVTVWRGR